MAKYSFESTTIGEVIETPALAEMFYELVPEAKDYEDIIAGIKPGTIAGSSSWILDGVHVYKETGSAL